MGTLVKKLDGRWSINEHELAVGNKVSIRIYIGTTVVIWAHGEIGDGKDGPVFLWNNIEGQKPCKIELTEGTLACFRSEMP